jgi:arylsulfatase A-like enzyme
VQSVTRREFLRQGTLATVGLAGLAAAAPAAGQRPNVLFIMSDDHASHAIGCYGSRINKTPHIDRLATEGMRFDNCFCTNSICGPSRAVILTGKYSHRNGFYNNGNSFDGEQVTLPKLLKQVGYQTAMIGKWHLKSAPTGFDYWSVLPGQGAYYNPVLIENGTKKQHEGYVSEIITDIALNWLKTGRDPDQPFLMMCHHKAPHRNWKPGPKYKDMYEDTDIPLPETFDDDYATRSEAAHQQAMTIEQHLTPADLKVKPPEGLAGAELKRWKYQRYIKDYLRCVASVDDSVGQILDYLDASGLAENTLVVYTSDQGFYLGDHGWFDKRFMYEESLRMPLLARLPGTIKPGSTSDDMVLNLDFAPTFLDLAGTKPPADMQGRSMKPILAGTSPGDWRDAIYYHYYEYPGAHSVKRHYGVRTERYKLIHFYYDIDAWEFYDLQTDPNELRNRIDDPAAAPVIAGLRKRLEELRQQYGDTDEELEKTLPQPSKGILLDLDFAEPAGAAKAVNHVDGKRRITDLVYRGTTPVADGKGRRFSGSGDRIELDARHCPNPTKQPITITARFLPENDNGVILAHGGATWGYCLHLQDGSLAFTVAVDDVTTTAALPGKAVGTWIDATATLGKDGQLVLTDGTAIARAKAAGPLQQKPNDALQIGADTGSRIGTASGDRSFKGIVERLRLVYGK